MTIRRNTTLRDRHPSQIKRGRPACAICGQPIDYTLPYPEALSFVVDHVIALNRGGTDTLENKQPAHRACNAAKSDKQMAPIIRRSGSLRREAEAS